MKLKPEELKISENDLFDGNILFRNESTADVLTQIVKNAEGGFTLSINADWGYGKTTFIKMWEKALQKEGYKTIYFNAWETDFVADPMMALIDGLRDGFDGKDLPVETLQKISAFWDAIIGIVQAMPSAKMQLIGGAAKTAKKGIMSLLKDKNKLQEHQSIRKLVTDFRNQLTELAKTIDKDKQLIIFVDELDRCRPDYAVQMLERIKHFFAIDNIIFVLSIDRTVLCKAIKAIYGGLDIDTDAYLRRFIDFSYDLPNPRTHDFVKMLYEQHKLDEYFATYRNWNARTYGGVDRNATFLETIKLCITSTPHSLRDIEKYIARLNVVVRSMDPDEMPLALVVFLVYFNMFHPNIYTSFRDRNCDAQVLWEDINKILIGRIQEDETKEAVVEQLIKVLIYYIKWEMQVEDYRYKDRSLQRIVDQNDVTWLPGKYRQTFRKSIEQAKSGDFKYLFYRIELVLANFHWRDLEDVISK